MGVQQAPHAHALHDSNTMPMGDIPSMLDICLVQGVPAEQASSQQGTMWQFSGLFLINLNAAVIACSSHSHANLLGNLVHERDKPMQVALLFDLFHIAKWQESVAIWILL